MRTLFLAGLVLSIIAFSATAGEQTTSTNTFTLLEKKPEAQPVGGGPTSRTLPDYSQGVPVAETQQAQQESKCRVRKTVEAGVVMGGVSGTYAGARLDYGKDDKALARGYAPNPCPDTGFAMSIAVSGSDMEAKRRNDVRDRFQTDADRRPDLTER
ncbi:hypothetical protein CHU95_15310 [Niveispirillum lacus]|uniref:Uncharacterized protein n=1 Tax=Niveispirillum lacus TaxID=1981099 RepID=A0A255YWV5_9PROT|nr:hypothetical protein [Niveispirillum lacus]OYQ33716.1 hypothetical protein CHU95_15310 [Niveispirillum lacus]